MTVATEPLKATTARRRFRRKKDAEAFLDKTCGQLRDGTFRKVQPAPMKKVFKTWLSDELDVRLATGDRHEAEHGPDLSQHCREALH